MEGSEPDVSVLHRDFQDELLEHVDGIFVLLDQNEVAELGQIKVQIRHTLVMELLNQVLHDALLFFAFKVSETHMDVEKGALKET